MRYHPPGRMGFGASGDEKRINRSPEELLILLPVSRFLAGSAGGAIVDSPARSEAECRETGTKIRKSRRDD